MHRALFIPIIVFYSIIFATLFYEPTEASISFTSNHFLPKKSIISDRINEDYPDYQMGVKYDEYPTIVPKKRTALLVNRLMVALKEALEEDEKAKIEEIPSVFGNNGNLYSDDIRKMDLQRRGHQTSPLTINDNKINKPRLYWRCFFNAVTCF